MHHRWPCSRLRHPLFLFLKLIFYLSIVVSFHSKMNQLYIYIHPLFFRFYSLTGHNRVLSRVPCACQRQSFFYHQRVTLERGTPQNPEFCSGKPAIRQRSVFLQLWIYAPLHFVFWWLIHWFNVPTRLQTSRIPVQCHYHILQNKPNPWYIIYHDQWLWINKFCHNADVTQ